jgi:hypothetical protein|tara:strand:+ start:235 stop:441 length:207 start_codon:yes stop_codon:yes gene_type:complete
MYIEDNKELSIPEVAKVLEVDNTYAYRLVRDERLAPVRTSPYKVTFGEVKGFINQRLPTGFKSIYQAF